MLKVEINDDAATALAQMCKRFTYSDAERLSSPHGGGHERDAMLDGIIALQLALSKSGFAPR